MTSRFSGSRWKLPLASDGEPLGRLSMSSPFGVEVMPVSEHEQSVRAFGERWGAAEQEIRFQKSEVLKWNKLAVEERTRLEALRKAAQAVVTRIDIGSVRVDPAIADLRVVLNPESKEHS